jgi:integrase
MANRYVDLLAAVFAFAELEEMRPPATNPCQHVERIKLAPKRQSLREEDYHSLGAALVRAAKVGLPSAPARRSRSRGMSRKRRAKLTGRKRGPYKLAERLPAPQNAVALAMIRFLALSGWRSSEAKSLRWADLDTRRGVAILPDTKTGRSARPLGAAALAVVTELRKREEYPEDHQFVFPGARENAPLVEIDHVWAAVRHAAKLEITLHGLRHAFTTTARSLGFGDHVIARLVGHVMNDSMTSRYGDVPEPLVHDAAQRVARHIAGMLAITPFKVLRFPAMAST